MVSEVEKAAEVELSDDAKSKKGDDDVKIE